jgi:hypothetical protein
MSLSVARLCSLAVPTYQSHPSSSRAATTTCPGSPPLSALPFLPKPRPLYTRAKPNALPADRWVPPLFLLPSPSALPAVPLPLTPLLMRRCPRFPLASQSSRCEAHHASSATVPSRHHQSCHQVCYSLPVLSRERPRSATPKTGSPWLTHHVGWHQVQTGGWNHLSGDAPPRSVVAPSTRSGGPGSWTRLTPPCTGLHGHEPGHHFPGLSQPTASRLSMQVAHRAVT